jgi:hypothetical protein
MIMSASSSAGKGNAKVAKVAGAWGENSGIATSLGVTAIGVTAIGVTAIGVGALDRELQAPGPQGSLSDLAGQLEQYVQSAAANALPLHEVERNVFDAVLSLGKAATEQFLRSQGDGDLGPTVTTPEGQTLHRSEAPTARPLRTIFGLHTIQAYVYASGPHEKIQLRPVDARLQLGPQQASYLFEEFSQYFCVEQAFQASAAAIDVVFRQRVSVDVLQHINQSLGREAAEFFEELPTPPAAEEGELLVLTGDGKGVPMVKADAAQLAAFEEPLDRPGNRRMAILTGVYSVNRFVRTPEEIVAALFREGPRPHDRDRPRPQFKRLRGCFAKTYDADSEQPTIVSGAFESFSWAAMEIQARWRPNQPVPCLIDGQDSLWEAALASLEIAPLPRAQLVEILDVLHASQYVWRAAKVFHTTHEHREAFVRERLLRILRGEVRGVIASLRQMASRRKLRGQSRREISIVCGYFQKHAHRMRYDEYLRQGYPIATGVIEGACRHLVKDRLERSGMRWRLCNAQAMLNVRALFKSSDWQAFHAWRRARNLQQHHPHRNLIAQSAPTPLAA